MVDCLIALHLCTRVVVVGLFVFGVSCWVCCFGFGSCWVLRCIGLFDLLFLLIGCVLFNSVVWFGFFGLFIWCLLCLAFVGLLHGGWFTDGCCYLLVADLFLWLVGGFGFGLSLLR